MIVEPESTAECLELMKRICYHLRLSAETMGHEVMSCPCDLCRACKYADKSEAELRNFKQSGL